MSNIAATQQLDGNGRVIASNEAILLESTWTFVAGTTGATGAHTLFTVTGNCLVSVFGVVDTTLVGATATIEAGVTGNTAALIAQGAAPSLADGEVWVDGTLTRVGVGAVPAMQVLNDGNDIILTIATAALSAGAIDFYCLFRPLSADGNVTVTTPA